VDLVSNAGSNKRRAITMFIGPFVEPFAKAEREYRREQIAGHFRRSPRPLHLRWPVGPMSPIRRRPRHAQAGRPAPQCVTSIG
jgi:hypothetical protein